MSEPRTPLHTDRFYYLYNYVVGSDLFFNNRGDYLEFLSKANSFISPVSEILSFALIPNEFHFVVYVKSREEVLDYLLTKLDFNRFLKLSDREFFVEEQLSRIYSNWFSSYAKYYNLKYGRIGTLFKRAFQRELVNTPDDLISQINQVHTLPVESGIASKPEEWKYSSFNQFLKKEFSTVSITKLSEVFDDISIFDSCAPQVVNG